jgi:hypothetical protein
VLSISNPTDVWHYDSTWLWRIFWFGRLMARSGLHLSALLLLTHRTLIMLHRAAAHVEVTVLR